MLVLLSRVGRYAAIALLLGTLGCEAGRESSKALDEWWDAQMLAGEYGILGHGRRVESRPEKSFKSQNGRVYGVALLTKEGIAITDMGAESRLAGLWTCGGWALAGGLLERVGISDGLLELYGKLRTRREPFFVLNLMARVNPPEQYSYEFFLLYRAKEKARGQVIKRWSLEFGDKDPIAAGHLEYDAVSRVAMVKVQSFIGQELLHERVDVSSVVRGQ